MTIDNETLDFVTSVDATLLHTYLAMCCVADDHGVVTIERDELASRLGTTVQTFMKRVRRLQNDGWLRLDRSGRICLTKSVNFTRVFIDVPLDSYVSNTNTPTKNEQTPVESMDVIKRWSERYKDRYNESYKYGNFAIAKNTAASLVRRYGDRILDIIDVIFANYDQVWSTPQFRRPTFGQLSKWLGEQASAFVEKSTEAKAVDTTIDLKGMI